MSNETTESNKDGLRNTASRVSVLLHEGHQDLNLKQLYYFHAVATEGTIARAAKKLRLSQATISEQLKKLEEYLNTPLMERRTTGVRMNQHGRRVFEHTTAMFRVVHRMLQDINPSRLRDRWVLEVGVCPTISRTFAIQRFLPLFELEHIRLRVRQQAYESLISDLLSGSLDLIITENRPAVQEQDKLGISVLSESSLVFVANPEVAQQVQDFPKDLGGLPYLGYSNTSIYRYQVEHFMVSHGLAPEVIGEVDDVSLMTALAATGRCVVAVPRSVVQGELERQGLVVLGDVEDSHTKIYACYQASKPSEAILQAVAKLTEHNIEAE